MQKSNVRRTSMTRPSGAVELSSVGKAEPAEIAAAMPAIKGSLTAKGECGAARNNTDASALRAPVLKYRDNSRNLKVLGAHLFFLFSFSLARAVGLVFHFENLRKLHMSFGN